MAKRKSDSRRSSVAGAKSSRVGGASSGGAASRSKQPVNKPINFGKVRSIGAWREWENETAKLASMEIDDIVKLCNKVFNDGDGRLLPSVPEGCYQVNWQSVFKNNPLLDESEAKSVWKFLSIGRLPIPFNEGEYTQYWKSLSEDDANSLFAKDAVSEWFPPNEDWTQLDSIQYYKKYHLRRALRAQAQAEGQQGMQRHMTSVEQNATLESIQEKQAESGFLEWVRANKAQEVASLLTKVQASEEGLAPDEMLRKQNAIEQEVSKFYENLQIQWGNLPEQERVHYRMVVMEQQRQKNAEGKGDEEEEDDDEEEETVANKDREAHPKTNEEPVAQEATKQEPPVQQKPKQITEVPIETFVKAKPSKESKPKKENSLEAFAKAMSSVDSKQAKGHTKALDTQATKHTDTKDEPTKIDAPVVGDHVDN